MSVHLPSGVLATSGQIVAPPPRAPRCCEDRNFGLPPALLLGVFGLFLAYLGVMSVGFMEPSLVLPMVINFIFVTAFAFVPAKWATMKPAKRDRAMRWAEFREHGILCATGHSSAAEAATPVLLLPALILLWGIAVVTIAAWA